LTLTSEIICVVTEQKQKQFLFVIGKLSGQFIFREDHCQTGHTRQSTFCLYLCKAFTDFKNFSLSD